MGDKEKSSWILYMGTFPPRECGIATFTKDLSTAVNKRFSPRMTSKILAMNLGSIDLNDHTTNYPKNVMFQLDEDDIQGYTDLAKKINKIGDIKYVSIQHEYGIFGGKYGEHITEFLKELKKPVIVTLHTIKDNPDRKRKKVTQDIARYSDAIVVLIEKSKDILEKEYGLDANKIFVIPHGIHHIDFAHPPENKKFFNTKGKIVMSTFGLLGAKTKGIDYTIEALALLKKDYPNLLYAIIGAVHPKVIKSGVDYTGNLKKRIKKLGIENNVLFFDRFLELDELLRALSETDIYLTPFTEKDRKSSGTLSYAMGCGRVCISTPFYFAEDIIDHGKNGLLVEFGNAEDFVNAIRKILDNSELKKSIEKKAYEKTRPMLWETVANKYNDIYEEIIR